MPKKNKLIMSICYRLRLCNLPYKPYVLGADTGNICNLKCPLCPTGRKSQTIKRGMLRFETFKRIITEIGAGLRELNLFNWGEPFLNPDLLRMISYARAKNKNMRIATSTNLNFSLTDKLVKDILNSGLDELSVSFDAATPQTYVKYRIGGDFNLLLENLRKLTVGKKCYPESKLKIVLNYLVFRHNEHEIEKARDIAKMLGIEMKIGKMRTEMESEITQPIEKSIEEYKNWIPTNYEYSAYNIKNKTRKKELKTCKKPWREVELNWDGTITPCCYIYDIEKYGFGNLNQSSFKEIWNNKLYIAARKTIMGKQSDIETICHICKRNGYTHM